MGGKYFPSNAGRMRVHFVLLQDFYLSLIFDDKKSQYHRFVFPVRIFSWSSAVPPDVTRGEVNTMKKKKQ